MVQHCPCRRPPLPYRSAHTCAVPGVSQPLASYRGSPWPYCSPWLPCIATHGRPLSAKIQFCIATQLPAARYLRARAPLALCAGRPYRGPLMVISWRRLGRVVAPWMRPGQPSQPLCHDTNCCIVTQCMLKMGSSPAAACNASLFFFFTPIFFSHSSY